jgi:hypothetical protein
LLLPNIVVEAEVAYLTTLSISRLYSVDNSIGNECGAAGGMRMEETKNYEVRVTVNYTFIPNLLKLVNWLKRLKKTYSRVL